MSFKKIMICVMVILLVGIDRQVEQGRQCVFMWKPLQKQTLRTQRGSNCSTHVGLILKYILGKGVMRI
jgi:hypothetical protein